PRHLIILETLVSRTFRSAPNFDLTPSETGAIRVPKLKGGSASIRPHAGKEFVYTRNFREPPSCNTFFG
ncbi:MAG: hypothetical protein WBL33_05685, partial [Candidatus Acidiferrales bacterium]